MARCSSSFHLQFFSKRSASWVRGISHSCSYFRFWWWFSWWWILNCDKWWHWWSLSSSWWQGTVMIRIAGTTSLFLSTEKSSNFWAPQAARFLSLYLSLFAEDDPRLKFCYGWTCTVDSSCSCSVCHAWTEASSQAMPWQLELVWTFEPNTHAHIRSISGKHTVSIVNHSPGGPPWPLWMAVSSVSGCFCSDWQWLRWSRQGVGKVGGNCKS